ncbi:DNA polymerase I [Fervidobacterium sp.]
MKLWWVLLKNDFMDRLFVFDTSNIVYRGFFAFAGRHLRNSKGEITSGIFSAIRTILRLYKDFRFDLVVFSLDGPREQTNRFKIYSDYKVTRQKAPDDLKFQLSEVVRILRGADINCVSVPGLESDDVIASVVKKYSQNYEIFVVSGDKDLLQLLTNDNVRVVSFSPSKSEYEVIDRSSFVKEFGFEPEYIVDYLSLIGDAVDNVPGVKGIGEKTASYLVSKYRTLENIYDNLDNESPTIKEKLLAGKDDAFLSKELIKLIVADIDVEPSKFSLESFRKPQVLEILNYHGFKSIIKEIQPEVESSFQSSLFSSQDTLFSYMSNSTSQVHALSTSKQEKGNYKLVTSRESLSELLAKIKEKKLVSIDIETDEKHFMECSLIGVALAYEEGEGYYIPILHRVQKSVSNEEIFSFLREVCESLDIKKVGHNIKYEYIVLKRHGIELRNIYFDTMIASYLLNPELQQHNLDKLAEQYLNYTKVRYEDVTRKSLDRSLTLLDAPIESVLNYAAEDADITLRLYKVFKEKLSANPKLEKLLFEVEMPLVVVLAQMEMNGIKVDTEFLKGLSKELDREIKATANEIFNLAGEVFNINSPKQLSYILFEKLKIEPIEKTKTGYSTSEEVLEELSENYEIAKYLIKYRTLTKLKSTYVDELPTMIVPSTGRVHTSFNQTVTATGRLSSSNPNLQNIPVRDDLGKKIRQAFISEDGYLLGSFDYSQIELRVLAHVSEDRVLMEQFINNEDVHTITASMVLGVKPEEVTPEMRRIGKTINFGIVYGISPYGLSKQLRISTSEASEIINKYFEIYKGIKEYILKTLEFVSKNGYVETIFGRIRYIPELKGRVYNKAQITLNKSERIAVNTPIQGSAADIVKIAMIKLYENIRDTSVRLLLQVHDEILVEVPEDEVGKYEFLIKDTLESAVVLKVPLVVEYKFGKSWGDIH